MTGQAPDIQLPWDLHYGEANSPWEVRQRIRQLAHDGVDVIKVLSTGAVLDAREQSQFTRVHSRGTPGRGRRGRVTLVCGSRCTHMPHKGIKNAILAGAASIEHAEMVDDEGIALASASMARTSIWISTTKNASKEGGKMARHRLTFLQHDAELGQLQRDNSANHSKPDEDGLLGTDDAGIAPTAPAARSNLPSWSSMERDAHASDPRPRASGAADLLGHSKEVGSIKPGKFAGPGWRFSRPAPGH